MLANIGSKLEPVSYKLGECVVRSRFACDPVCILYEGEVESLETKRVVRAKGLVWDLAAEMDDHPDDLKFVFKKKGMVLRLTR